MWDRDQLSALAAIADTGTFEAAARRLAISPSAVSQRIRGLERAAGAVLVQRTRPCRPTEAGEPLVRLARQFEALEAEVAGAVHGGDGVTVSVAVNADSMSTWFVAAMAAASATGGLRFTVHVDDENRTAALLREGTVMAAVTTTANPVQGCRSTRLGSLRYRAVAAAGLADAWDDPLVAFASVPRIDYDESDLLPRRLVRPIARVKPDGPAHVVPSSHGYLAAIEAGLGWSAVPESIALSGIARGALVDVAPGHHLDVPLFWQQWRIETAALRTLTAAVTTAATDHLVAAKR